MLALALFVLRVLLVDHIKLPLTANYLAISAALFDGCSNLHCYLYL
jgi:hypothetical protein